MSQAGANSSPTRPHPPPHPTPSLLRTCQDANPRFSETLQREESRAGAAVGEYISPDELRAINAAVVPRAPAAGTESSPRVTLSAAMEGLRRIELSARVSSGLGAKAFALLRRRRDLAEATITAFIAATGATRLGATSTLSLRQADKPERCAEFLVRKTEIEAGSQGVSAVADPRTRWLLPRWQVSRASTASLLSDPSPDIFASCIFQCNFSDAQQAFAFAASALSQALPDSPDAGNESYEFRWTATEDAHSEAAGGFFLCKASTAPEPFAKAASCVLETFSTARIADPTTEVTIDVSFWFKRHNPLEGQDDRSSVEPGGVAAAVRSAPSGTALGFEGAKDEPRSVAPSPAVLSSDIITSGSFQCEAAIRARVFSGVTLFRPATVEMEITVAIRCELGKRAALSVALDDITFEVGRSGPSEFDDFDSVMCDGVGIPLWPRMGPEALLIFAGVAPWLAGCVILTLVEDGMHNLDQNGAATAALVREAVNTLNGETAPHLRWRLVPWQDRNLYRHVVHVGYFGQGTPYSFVGMVRAQSQRVNLPTGVTRGNVIHELLHTAGLFHEHQRHDRDLHVEFHPENCIAEYRSQFGLLPQNQSLSVLYDVFSIMHYPWDAFQSRRGDDTCIVLLPLNGHQRGVIGQRDAMSNGDRVAINVLYPTKLIDAGAGSCHFFSRAPWDASTALQEAQPWWWHVPVLSSIYASFSRPGFWDHMSAATEYRDCRWVRVPADVRFTDVSLRVALPRLVAVFPGAGHDELIQALATAPAGSDVRLYAFNNRVFRISLRLPHDATEAAPQANIDIAAAFCRCVGAPRLPAVGDLNLANFERFRSAVVGAHTYAVARVCVTHVFLEVCKNVSQVPCSEAPEAPVREGDAVSGAVEF